MKGPLSGIRVIEIAGGGAVSFGCMMLADLGAEVIEIEAGAGATQRRTPGPNHRGESYHFLAYHRGKKSLYLDLGTETGKEAFYDLVRVSDVLFSGRRPDVLERLGADFDTLKEINPRLICCSVTAYGSSGPYRDRPAYDPVLAGLSGLASLIGEAGSPPFWCQIAFVDYATGTNGALGIVSALLHRERTGLGQKVEVALLDTAVSYLTFYATHYFLSGELLPRSARHHAGAPFGAYPTKDGYIMLGSCWPRICRALGAEWLVADPRFAELEARLKNRDELDKILTELFLKEKTQDWLEILYAEDIPAAPVNTVAEMAVDPQVLHNKMIIEVPHSLGGVVKMVGDPIKMPGCIEGEYLSQPTLGQHTEEILTKLLGYSEQKIGRLKEEQEKHAEKLKARLLKSQ